MTTAADNTIAARQATLLKEIERRGVKPIISINDFQGEFWDARDEATQNFDAWLRRTRNEGDAHLDKERTSNV